MFCFALLNLVFNFFATGLSGGNRIFCCGREACMGFDPMTRSAIQRRLPAELNNCERSVCGFVIYPWRTKTKE